MGLGQDQQRLVLLTRGKRNGKEKTIEGTNARQEMDPASTRASRTNFMVLRSPREKEETLEEEMDDSLKNDVEP